MNAEHLLQHEGAEITAEVSSNYQRMIQARTDNQDVLEATFEGRMNRGLEEYHDLLRAIGHSAVART